jgi:hypothetical protein
LSAAHVCRDRGFKATRATSSSRWDAITLTDMGLGDSTAWGFIGGLLVAWFSRIVPDLVNRRADRKSSLRRERQEAYGAVLMAARRAFAASDYRTWFAGWDEEVGDEPKPHEEATYRAVAALMESLSPLMVLAPADTFDAAHDYANYVAHLIEHKYVPESGGDSVDDKLRQYMRNVFVDYAQRDLGMERTQSRSSVQEMKSFIDESAPRRVLD